MFFKRDVALAQEYLAFLLLNLFDLFLTKYIIENSGAEANALAAYVLQKFHGPGFVLYKFGLMVVLIVCCELIAAKNLRLSRTIMTVGCFLYVLLVLYECFLVFTRVLGPAAGLVPPAT